MAPHGQIEPASSGARGRMHQALRQAVARAGGTRRVSGLSLMAVLCASAIAPVALVGQTIGPALTAWLAAAGAVGSNVLADVITSVVSRRASDTAGQEATLEVQQAVAAELEMRMAASGREAAVLRGEVAGLLREQGAPQVLLEVLVEGNAELQEVLAESIASLSGQFREFVDLLSGVREGVIELQAAAHEQRAEREIQGQHRQTVQLALARILVLLENRSPASSGTAAVYNTLPPDTAAFTGRHTEISEIMQQITSAAHSGAMAICAIYGMPGVGKTALALRMAHRLSAVFPDRQLFVDLHAHTADIPPADPSATLTSLLVGDGVDPRLLPESLEELSALWRARMADRRALLVLDNAADSAQVTPLLPGSRSCLVLITSRRHLGDIPTALAARSLDVLPPEDATVMFRRQTSRVVGQNEPVTELVALAGYLPLAIALLARVHDKHRAWSMDELIQETRARMLSLTAERHTITATFDLSYYTLAPDVEHFFRLLCLHIGSVMDPYAAAALTGRSLQQTTRYLESLHSDHLLTEPGYRRYGMHDLLRAYGRSLTYATDPSHEREAALDRLLRYYGTTAESASRLIARYPKHPPASPAAFHAPVLADPEAARTWLRTERSEMEAAFVHACAHGLDMHTIALAAGLAEILLADGPWPRALEIHQAAAEAAERSGHPAARACALTDLGQVRHVIGDYSGAMDVHSRALEIYRQIGDRLGEANALNGLGLARRLTGNYAGDNSALNQALGIYREIGNLLGEANVLTDLGRKYYVTGDLPGAAKAYSRALEIYRQIGDHLGEANALNGLGLVRAMTGDYPKSGDLLIEALEIYRALRHRLGEGNALNDLGRLRRLTGDYAGAVDAQQRALDIYGEIGHRLGQATALTDLGRMRSATGDHPTARDILSRALEIYHSLGQRDGEAYALTELGRARYMASDYPSAGELLTQALEIYRELGARGNEAWALNCYAATLAATNQPTRALELFQQALAINRELNKPDDEAISLEGIAEHQLFSGDLRQGVTYLREALAIYQRLGMSADSERIQTRLAEITKSRRNPPPNSKR